MSEATELPAAACPGHCNSAVSSQLSGSCFSWSLWQREAFGFLMVLEKNGEGKSKFRRTKIHSFSNLNIKHSK